MEEYQETVYKQQDKKDKWAVESEQIENTDSQFQRN